MADIVRGGRAALGRPCCDGDDLALLLRRVIWEVAKEPVVSGRLWRPRMDYRASRAARRQGLWWRRKRECLGKIPLGPAPLPAQAEHVARGTDGSNPCTSLSLYRRVCFEPDSLNQGAEYFMPSQIRSRDSRTRSASFECASGSHTTLVVPALIADDGNDASWRVRARSTR
jgi:hypothetical protein